MQRERGSNEEANAARIAHDDSPDLQQLDANRLGLGVGQFRSRQSNAPQALHQEIAKGSDQQTKLIGPPTMATGAVGKEAQLALLDAVLHLTPRAIDPPHTAIADAPRGW